MPVECYYMDLTNNNDSNIHYDLKKLWTHKCMTRLIVFDIDSDGSSRVRRILTAALMTINARMK